MNKLYIGNLSPAVTAEELRQLFGDRKLPLTGQVLLKSGYAFVDYPDQNWAIRAIETLSGKPGSAALRTGQGARGDPGPLPPPPAGPFLSRAGRGPFEPARRRARGGELLPGWGGGFAEGPLLSPRAGRDRCPAVGRGGSPCCLSPGCTAAGAPEPVPAPRALLAVLPSVLRSSRRPGGPAGEGGIFR